MKKQKGITLIALVITIIVLLILAGVSLSLVAGSDGILSKASKAVDKNKTASAKEIAELVIMDVQADYYDKTYVEDDYTMSKTDYIMEALKEGKISGSYLVKAEDGKIKVYQGEGDTLTEVASGTLTEEGRMEWDDQVGGGSISKPTASGTVSYNANGGEGTVPESQTNVKEGTTVNVDTTVILTKAGYEFLGWARSSNATEAITSFTMPGGDVTLYAVWRLVNVQGGTWTQDKISVKNGAVTLMVGSKVRGYTANGVSDWYVLGAKDGKLLITTNSNPTTVQLSGQEGYVNGIAKLNTTAEAYTDTNFAEGNARTIDIDDINRVTGYDPDVANYNNGTTDVSQWKNEVTYTKISTNNIYCKGTKYPRTTSTYASSSFTYWAGSEWKTLATGQSTMLTNTYYLYYPQTLTSTSGSGSQIKDVVNSEAAYNLLFANTSGSNDKYYWLGSQFVNTDAGYVSFGVRNVFESRVRGNDLYDSRGSTISNTYGVRPVVSLKSSIKVGSDGSLSL